MSLCNPSDSCLHYDVIVASPIFVHRGQHHLIPFSKGTIKSLYSILLSFYFWPWMSVVSHSSFEQGNVACSGKEKFYPLVMPAFIKLRSVTVALPLIVWKSIPKFATGHLRSVCSCIASNKSLCVLHSPSISRLITTQAWNLGRISTSRNVLHSSLRIHLVPKLISVFCQTSSNYRLLGYDIVYYSK
jgi:hypothetical protein